jgi:hypothetical protein
MNPPPTAAMLPAPARAVDLDTQRYVNLKTGDVREAKALPADLRERLESGDEPIVDHWSHVDGAWKCGSCGVWFAEYEDGRGEHEEPGSTCGCCQERACSDCIDEGKNCRACNEGADERAYVRGLR